MTAPSFVSKKRRQILLDACARVAAAERDRNIAHARNHGALFRDPHTHDYDAHQALIDAKYERELERIAAIQAREQAYLDRMPPRAAAEFEKAGGNRELAEAKAEADRRLRAERARKRQGAAWAAHMGQDW